MDVFETYESEVRSYCRSFPKLFTRAKMSKMFTADGEEYLDFFSGAGALNYGHNNKYIMEPVIDYIKNNGILHGLDLNTSAKKDFMETFIDKILRPRNLDYKMMFCGSTGTNANEAALKIARKVKGKSNIISFSGGFHGMSLGSLSLTSSNFDRGGAGVHLGNVTFMPYPFGFGETFDTIDYLQDVLNDDHSGIDKPAAIFIETVQAEGGVIVSNVEWLKRLRKLCTENDILLIVDDIQAGCGRTGNFFSFERAGIIPDMITMSKSISGCGFPMSLLLIRPDIDCLRPAEHNGTFRGNQLAFIAGKAAINYAIETNLWDKTYEAGKVIKKFFEEKIYPLNSGLSYRGIGLIHGIDFNDISTQRPLAKIVSKECFENGLVIECAGRNNNVLKLLPPLVIEKDELEAGLGIIQISIEKILNKEWYKYNFASL